MTVAAWIEIVAIVVTTVIAMFGSTWFISTRLAEVRTTVTALSRDLRDHLERDDRRFDEVFSQQRELANQHFWLSNQADKRTI